MSDFVAACFKSNSIVIEVGMINNDMHANIVVVPIACGRMASMRSFVRIY